MSEHLSEDEGCPCQTCSTFRGKIAQLEKLFEIAQEKEVHLRRARHDAQLYGIARAQEIEELEKLVYSGEVPQKALRAAGEEARLLRAHLFEVHECNCPELLRGAPAKETTCDP